MVIAAASQTQVLGRASTDWCEVTVNDLCCDPTITLDWIDPAELKVYTQTE